MDKFFAFIDMVDDNSSGIPNYVIEDLCNGTISLKDWQNDIVKLRREFEKSMFVNCVEKTHFKEHLVKVAVNFQSIIKMYRNIIRTSCINGKKDIETNKKEYYINVCHHFMCAQLELAYRQIKYSMSDLEEMTDDYWKGTSKPYKPNKKVLNVQSKDDKGNDSKSMAFSPKYDNEKLQRIYQFLIDNRYLNMNTDKNDFIYYFSGKGEIPTQRLEWVGTVTDLAIFIHNFFFDEEKKWVKTAFVFDKKSNYTSIIERLSSRAKKDPFRGFAEEIRKKVIKNE